MSNCISGLFRIIYELSKVCLDMFHELLVALSGTPGAIFKVDKHNGLEVK